MTSQTGYPSIDKPWLSCYDRALSEEEIPKCSAYHLLYENNKDHMDEVALIYFNRKIKFREIFVKIHKTAASLKAFGIEKGDIVTLQVLNMPQVVYLFYALSYIGAVANMIYVSTPVEETRTLLYDTESKMYITIDFMWKKQKNAIHGTSVEHVLLLQVGEEADFMTKAAIHMLSKSKKDHTCMNWRAFLSYGKGMPEEVNEAECPVAMVYTGGTTGKSKAVVLANRSMNALVYQYKYSYISLKRGEKFMNTMPPFIAFGIVLALHMPLCLGIKNVLVIDPSPEKAGVYFFKYRPNFYVCGNSALENIMNHPKIQNLDLRFVKVLAAGGDTMPSVLESKTNIFLKSHDAKTTLCVGYGMTEVGSTVVTSTPDIYKEGTVGVPLPGTVVKIVDLTTQNELSYDEDGEVCFYTPTMMLGYFKDTDETNHIIRKHDDGKNWVHSGDIGHITKDGFLVISDRIKRIIMTWQDGIYHKVFPKLLEDIFMEIKGINAVSVVGRKITDVFHELIAFVVIDESKSKDEMLELLKNQANKHLNTWERPVEYRFIKELPRTAVGKVDYRELEKQV